jgi:hypothetical protein
MKESCMLKFPAFMVVAAVAISVCLPGPLCAAEQDKSVIGKWKLTKVLDSSEISALDDDEAQRLVGQVLTISEKEVRLGQRTCKEPDFEVTRAETNEYFERSAHASAKKLGLPNPVTAIHINCTYVYKKAPGRVVVHWKGVFFDSVRQ